MELVMKGVEYGICVGMGGRRMGGGRWDGRDRSANNFHSYPGLCHGGMGKTSVNSCDISGCEEQESAMKEKTNQIAISITKSLRYPEYRV
jgi:hypothetical protein